MADDCAVVASRRSGGRAARVALRAAPLAENMRPVRPGLSGGQYKPLTEAGVRRIHEAALDALEQIGLANAPKSGIEIMTGAGAILGDDGRIRFPRALVEDMLAIAARDITLYARDPKQDLELSGTRVYYGTAGAAVRNTSSGKSSRPITPLRARTTRRSTTFFNSRTLPGHACSVSVCSASADRVGHST